MQKPLFVVFDGNALVHRAYHAFERARPLTVPATGEMVSAVFGFTQMLLKVLGELKPDYCAVAFDMKGPTFRHELYHDYKATRRPTPDDLIAQLERVRQLVRELNIPVFEKQGFEADDIIGALSCQASAQGVATVVITGDADVMQLVSPDVKVLYPRPGKSFSDTVLFGEDAVLEKYGVRPSQITDLKGLVGDKSDNIPGVPGVGEKTALSLLGAYGSMEEIYAHIDEVEPQRIQDLLRKNETLAHQSKVLATIDTQMPVELDLDQSRTSRLDRDKAAAFFRELGFLSLLARLPAEAAPEPPPAPEVKYRVVSRQDELHGLSARLGKTARIAFDTETTGLDAMNADLVGISLAPAEGEAYYIPVGHVGWGTVEQLPLETVIAAVKPLLESEYPAKVAHNGKYDMTVLARYGIEVKNLACDSMVAAHLSGEKSLGLKALAAGRLGVEMVSITDIIGTGKKQITMSQVEIAVAGQYASADADMTLRLANLLEQDLRREDLWGLFTDLEMPLVPLLTRMERNGILLDGELLRSMSQGLGEQMLELTGQIYAAAGRQFNINSPLQLAVVLYDELAIPPLKKGKAGRSTEAGILEELGRQGHPIVNHILEYRQLAKLKSTYIDVLPTLVNRQTGRLHTSFNQTRTATGRLSSSDPNLQNIPVRGDIGREVRKAFVAPPGCRLLSADYSQIDLRVLADLSGDAELMAAFHADEDIHTATAARLFGKERDEITPDMRRLAKTVNFGVIYGMSDYGLEQATEFTREEAASFIMAYFEKYPGVSAYFEKTRQHAREEGYVATKLGRRRYIPEINAGNRQVREAAERMAINMPVQGTSADIIKVAMVNLDGEMAARGMASKMLLQVHDELVFEVPEAEMEEMRSLVPEMMAGALALAVPVKVDTREGPNWGEME